MGTWAEHIQKLKTEFIGTEVEYEGKNYKIVDVDMNGILHINKPTEHNATTAAFFPGEVRK